MVVVSYSGKEINAKLVYYGAGLSGKTTNLESIYEAVPESSRGKMVSMKTQSDRTLFFDLLPLDLGEIMGFKTRFLLYTVPGQVFYNATRKLVLKGADAIVFVADSEVGKMDENKESLANLRANLIEYDLKLDEISWVIQYNKRDLANVYSIEELDRELNPGGVPSFEAVATQGKGVFETFRGISHLLMEKVTRELRRTPMSGSRGARTDEAPARTPSASPDASIAAAIRFAPTPPATPATPPAASPGRIPTMPAVANRAEIVTPATVTPSTIPPAAATPPALAMPPAPPPALAMPPAPPPALAMPPAPPPALAMPPAPPPALPTPPSAPIAAESPGRGMAAGPMRPDSQGTAFHYGREVSLPSTSEPAPATPATGDAHGRDFDERRPFETEAPLTFEPRMARPAPAAPEPPARTSEPRSPLSPRHESTLDLAEQTDSTPSRPSVTPAAATETAPTPAAAATTEVVVPVSIPRGASREIVLRIVITHDSE